MTVERTVAGQRLLRLLARGERSEVWLAAGDRALKVLEHPVPLDQPGHEAEALHRARGEHVVELLDVSLGPGSAVLVFERLPRGSLAELLIRRPVLDAGEAVTVLAPLAACLARMHAAGVAHGAVSAASVLFRADGAPMLTGFGRAELFAPGLPEVALEGIAGVAADRAALVALADAVLSRVTGERARVAGRLLADLRATQAGAIAEQLGREVFELAAARPVRFDAEEPAAEGAGRLVAVGEPVAGEAVPSTGRLARGIHRLVDAGPVATIRAVAGERWRGWSPRRRRVTLAIGAAGFAIVAAFVVVPGPVAGVDAVAEPTVAPPPAGEVAEAGADDPAIIGDDPLLALEALLDRRERCFRELSLLCLDGVDQAGSAALDDDRAAVHDLIGGAQPPALVRADGAVLVERLGDSALVDLAPDSDPASVLLMKGEAGWRIRDYLAPEGTTEPEA